MTNPNPIMFEIAGSSGPQVVDTIDTSADAAFLELVVAGHPGKHRVLDYVNGTLLGWRDVPERPGRGRIMSSRSVGPISDGRSEYVVLFAPRPVPVENVETADDDDE